MPASDFMSGKCRDTGAVTRSKHQHLVQEKHGRVTANCAALQVRTATADTSKAYVFKPATAADFIAKQLSLDLRRCTSFSDVVQALQSYTNSTGGIVQQQQQTKQQHDSQLLQGLNARNLVTLWKTLKDVAGYRSHLQDAENGSYSELGQLPNHVQLSQSNMKSLLDLIARMEKLSLECMRNREWTHSDAVTALHAMAQLNHRPSNRWLSVFEKYTFPALLDLTPRYLSNALWACAALRFLPENRWLETAMQQSFHHADNQQLTPVGCAVLLWSVSRLAVYADESGAAPFLSQHQLSQVLLHCSEQLPFMQPRHVSMQLWALGHLAASRHVSIQAYLRHQYGMQHQPINNQQHWPVGNSASSLQDINDSVHMLLEAARRCGAQKLGPQGTANTLWAAAHLGVKLTPVSNGHSNGGHGVATVAVQQLMISSESQIPDMTPQQQYMVAWAAATLQAPVSQSWVHALLTSSQHQLDGYEPQSLAGLLWAFGKLGIKPRLDWMMTAMEVSQSWNDQWCERTFPLFLYSLSALGYYPKQMWAKSLTKKQEMAGLLPQMEPRELMMCVHALAKLRQPPHPEWSEKFVTCLHAVVQRTIAAGLTNVGSADIGGQQQQSYCNGSQATPGRVEQKQAALPPMLPQELSACLQGIAKLGMLPSANLLEDVDRLVCSWLEASHAITENNLHVSSFLLNQHAVARLGTRQLSGILYGLVRVSHQEVQRLVDSDTKASAYQATDQLLNNATISLISQCTLQLSLHNNGNASQHPQSSLQRSQPQPLAVDVAQACYALAMLGHSPSKGQLQDLSHITHQLLPYMTHRELSQCVWGMERLGLNDPDNDWINTMLVSFQRELQSVVNEQASASSRKATTAIGTPLLSVTTLLRTVTAWCSTPAVVKLFLSSDNQPILTSCLHTAQQIVDFESAHQPGAQTLPQPAIDMQQNGHDQQQFHHHHHHQEGIERHPETRINRNSNHIPESLQQTVDQRVRLQGPMPHTLTQYMMAVLSYSDVPRSKVETLSDSSQVTTTKEGTLFDDTQHAAYKDVVLKERFARWKLWRTHMQRQASHDRLLQASKGILARLKALVAHSDNQNFMHDDLDMRYMPWCFVLGAVCGTGVGF